MEYFSVRQNPDSSAELGEFEVREGNVLDKLGVVFTVRALSADPHDQSVPAAVLVRFPAGFVNPPHGHDCYRIAVIVSGSVTTEDGRKLTPGDAYITAPGEMIGPHTVGPDGYSMVELYPSLGGTTPITPDGTAFTEMLLAANS